MDANARSSASISNELAKFVFRGSERELRHSFKSISLDPHIIPTLHLPLSPAVLCPMLQSNK
jgi:hypothetical protein